MDSLYRDLILDHYKYPQNFGHLKSPSSTFKLYNSACGDLIEIDLKVLKNKVDKIAFNGEGCAISIASASLLTTFVLGKDVKTITKIGRDDILKLLGITLTPTRIKCALLPLEVLHKAVHLLQ